MTLRQKKEQLQVGHHIWPQGAGVVGEERIEKESWRCKLLTDHIQYGIMLEIGPGLDLKLNSYIIDRN